MARLDTLTALARLAGVSRQAVSKLAKGPLAPALIGRRIDLDHPAVVEYLAKKDAAPTTSKSNRSKRKKKPTPARPKPPKRGKKPTAPRPPPRRRRSSMRPVEAEDDDGRELAGATDVTEEDIEEYAHLSLDQLKEMFGTARAFVDWLDARKKISEIREKDLRNAETQGRLIERELVRTHVFSAIEAGNRRLLGDSPKTIARRLYALAKSGAPVEEAEAVVREIVSSQLRPVRATAARVLRDA